MPLSPKSLAGPGYIILNAIRVVNVIALLSVVVASFVMLVKTFIVSKFFFFDGVSHVITASIGMLLIASEVSLFRNYFARNWPLLSPNHGFVGLGVAMLILGVNVLGNLNKTATSQKSLGLAFWRVVISSGILIIVVGFLNILASYIFRDTSMKVTARQVRAKGAVAISQQNQQQKSASSLYSASTVQTPVTPTRSPRVFPSVARRPTLPSYHASPGLSPTSNYSAYVDKDGQDSRPPMNISAPLNINPQFAHLVRPEMAHHPSVRHV